MSLALLASVPLLTGAFAVVAPALFYRSATWTYRVLLAPLIFAVVTSFQGHWLVLTAGSLGTPLLHILPAFLRPKLVCRAPSMGRGGGDMGAVGLAAGFDADGDLTPWCPFMGFGFHSVGTVTVKECRGNRPLSATLGRAVRSRSLYVWKGLRNRGLPTLLNRLASHPADSTVRGVSVGPTNEPSCAGPDAQIESVLAALRVLRDGPADAVSFVELNISCPNLSGENCLQRPAIAARLIREAHEEGLLWEGATWVKFPLLTDEGEALELMEALVNAVPDAVTGLVVANLYRDRVSPVLDPAEVAALPGAGKFSGAPCAEPSNKLIRLARKQFGPRLRLVGCGGIFTAEDAYKKIRLGAESVQIASALVFDGPLVPLDLDRGLAAYLAADGFATLADAVGVDVDQ